MPINGDHYAFTWENINRAPDTAGVYELWDGSETIYIGRAQGRTTTIRSRLSDHKSGREGRCTQNATTYKREVCGNPVEREAQLIREYVAQHRALPRCNDRIE